MSRTFSDFEKEANEFENILKQFKNTKRPYVDKTFPNKMIQETKVNASSIDRWERIDKIYKAPLFAKDLINPGFIHQGEIGNCYFISALIRVAKDHRLVKLLFDIKTPNKILGKVRDSINLECGAVVIYFYCFGRKTPVLIDTLMPMKNNKLIFSKPSDSDKSIWFCLVEKAFAKLKGSYSNIVSGLLSKALYSLFGYYPVNKTYENFKSKSETKKMTPFDILMKYQSKNAIMSCSINNISEEEAEKKGLVTNHEYLIYKIRKHNDHMMICLINPWGHTEWNGDWSKNSPLWTKEMKTELDVSETENGIFWMDKNDFFKYFIEYTISKPINMEYYSRRLFIQLKPSDERVESPKFILKMNDKIPEDTKCKIHIVVERHNSINDYKDNEEIKYGIYLSEIYEYSTNSYDFTNNSENYTYSYKIKNTKSTIEITFNRCGKCMSLDDFYILIFCYYDFVLYDNAKPDYLYPKIENPATVFCNHSTKHLGVAKPLVVKQKSGNDYLGFASSYHTSKEDEKKVSRIFAKLADIESDYSFYSSLNNTKNDENDVNKEIDDPSVFEIESNDDFDDDDFDLCEFTDDEQSKNDLSDDISFENDLNDEDKQSDQNENSETKISSIKTFDSDFDDNMETDQNENSQTKIIVSTDDEEELNSENSDYDNSETDSTSNSEIYSDFLEESSDDQYDDKKPINGSSTDDENNLNDINQSTNSLNINDEKEIIKTQSEDSFEKQKIDDDKYVVQKKKGEKKKKENNEKAMYYDMKSVFPFYRSLEHCRSSLNESKKNINKKEYTIKTLSNKIESLKNEMELIKKSDSCEKRYNLEKKQKELDYLNKRLSKEIDELKNLKNKFNVEKQKIISEETKIKSLCDPYVLECVKNKEEERQKNINWPKYRLNPINIGKKPVNKKQQKQRQSFNKDQLNFLILNISPEKIHFSNDLGGTNPKTARKKRKVINDPLSDMIQIPYIKRSPFNNVRFNKKQI